MKDTNKRTGMLRKKCGSLRRVNSEKPSIPLRRIIRETTVTTYFEITAEVLKTGGEDMAEMLLHIAKNVTLTSKTPLAWSKMVVTPIHKKGNRLDPENYRAISLLSIPGKVYCRILC